VSFWDKLIGRGSLSEQDQSLQFALHQIIGYKPKNLPLFELALLHSSQGRTSKEGHKESNERLEYLGDAVLNMAIAEYLFKKYPFKDEGFLTEIRSRIVKRESLNLLARKMNIHKVMEFQDKDKLPPRDRAKSIYGNALEAIIGAVFLDRDYKYCKRFVLEKIVQQHLDLEQVIQTDSNYKSKIIEWAQKEHHEVVFESTAVEDSPPYNQFVVRLLVDDVETSVGTGTSKKKAEQDAALKACHQLKLP